jgi:uncharacterized protein (DUF697 family)
MREAAQILGLFSAAMLIVAVLTWVRLGRESALLRLDGRSISNSRQAELASQLLVLAFGLSAVAALLAIAGWVGL